MANDNRSSTPTGVGAKPWIKMRTDLWDDPRVSALCDTLETDEARIIGGLYRLWPIADAHSTDGELIGLTMPSVDRKCGLPGLAKALESVNWLTIHESGVTIPDFIVHNGQSAKTRAQNSLWQQARRAKKSRDSDVSRTKRDTNASPERQPGVSGMTREDELRRLKNTSEEPPSPQSAETPPPRQGYVDAWQEAAVGKAGLTAARQTIRTAQQKGYVPQQVIELAAVLTKRSDLGPGALAWRIQNVAPDRPLSEGWPQPKTSSKAALPETDIEQLTGPWASLGKGRRHEIAKMAGVDLGEFDCQGLRELPPDLKKPIVALLVHQPRLAT